MSPENDNNLQPSATEAAPAQRESVNSSSEPGAVIPQQASAGAATAAVRAPAPPEPAATAEGSATAETATATVESAEAIAPATEPATGTEEPAESTETMDQLLDQFSAPPSANEGEIFDGRVLAVTDAGVVVDVGGKFEGLVPAQEFLDSGEPIEFGEGQTIEVERLHERKDGYVLLSYVRAHRRRVWERIEKSYREHATVTGKVTEIGRAHV